jgi:hypothetical protein
MSNKAKSDRVSSLLATIQRTAPDDPNTPQSVTEDKPQHPKTRPAQHRTVQSPPKSRGRGKPVQFWFHEEDGRLVRELAAWLVGQGVRPTDSLVIRAALRTAKTDATFLQAYRHASQLDGRLKAHKHDSTQSHETA